MHILLLSGGSGKKLWPLSNDIRSKQFIKLFKNEDGKYESMIQRIYRQITACYPEAKIAVATSRSQASTVLNQLEDKVGISVEPERKDTFPAIAMALEYLKDVENVPEDEPVIVCPVDLYMEDDFFSLFEELTDIARHNRGIALLGTVPHEVQVDYGYIIPDTDSRISRVRSFKEKPDAMTAKRLIKDGALFNAGVFAFPMSYVLDLAHELIAFHDYDDLYSSYRGIKPISFDRAILEKADNIYVLRSTAFLNDLGTWNAIAEVTGERIIGDGYLSDSCRNSNVINDLDIPILAVGLDDIVISASQQGILVSNKEESVDISPYVSHISQEVMFAEKSWGELKVLDIGDDSVTIKLVVKAGKKMSYHSHEHRDEVWVILNGNGRTVVDGMEQPVSGGDVITMEAGCRHTIIADSDLTIIEVQRGKDITTKDKKKFDLE